MAATASAESVVNYQRVHPYDRWLESLGVQVVRERVERLGHDRFAALERDDVLFIDSSHVIRPQGDVVFEYLELPGPETRPTNQACAPPPRCFSSL